MGGEIMKNYDVTALGELLVDFTMNGLSAQQKTRAEKSRLRHQARLSRSKNRTTITKTLPPQEKVLAIRSSESDMLSLIALAKAKTQAKHQERE